MFKKRLDTRPDYTFHNAHMWVDYLELRALKSEDGILSLSDLRDLLNPELTDINCSLEEGEEKEEDKYERRYNDYFRHFTTRQNKYGDQYPFTVKDGVLYRKLKLNDLHTAYIYLLCCSQLRYFDGPSLSQFTSDFELLSVEYLRSVKNISDGPFVFGKNSANLTRYTGAIWNRISTLADDMGCTVCAFQDGFASNSTGDGGIDIVGWDNRWDETNSQFVYLGNCKCSDEWQETRNPSEYMKGLISLNNGAVNLYFIPFHFRNAGNHWHQPQSVAGRVVFDRFRLMNNFPIDFFLGTQSKLLVSTNFVG